MQDFTVNLKLACLWFKCMQSYFCNRDLSELYQISFCHVIRQEGIHCEILERMVDGERSRGRLRVACADNYKTWTGNRNYADLARRAQHRQEWQFKTDELPRWDGTARWWSNKIRRKELSVNQNKIPLSPFASLPGVNINTRCLSVHPCDLFNL